ncbi:MAG: tRNA lysidine(34) synthetase TilS [Spirochaetales bacterium]|nr:tRNA lysidine(34) synthetase TilS [Spirochaetales bacterium]
MPRTTPGSAQNAGTADPVPAAVLRFLADHYIVDSRVLVALSGGPDSVATLLATLQVSDAARLEVSACWVDHAIRPAGELAEERSFVETLCRNLGVPLFIEEITRGEIQRRARAEGGIEAAARNFRYKALERARSAESCAIVLTGHNADDVVETMVMRFCTGSGIAGLRGVPALHGLVGRPLLSVSRADILSYLASRGQAYRQDSTNNSDLYLRNRVRHELLPAMRSIFPAMDTSLATLAEKAHVDEDALSAMAEAMVAKASPEEPADGYTALRLDAVAFDAAPLAVRARALYAVAEPLGVARLPWRLVMAAARSAKITGRLASGAGIEFTRDSGAIYARALRDERTATSAATDADGFSIVIDGAGDYRIGKTLSCRVYSHDSPPGLRRDAFTWPLWIRSRRPGDGVALGSGTKMVDSLLSELGIPVSARGAVPVIEDGRGIVAVLASRLGCRDIYRQNDLVSATPPAGFVAFELKGDARTDAI